ncbi:hypothetical protein HNO51_04145 [Billgrantia sulfidoxydans]|uniref:Uncharacterized protein n=1 Tax=Billgrantia sulfidoxydans TaxID=2733484 RepID=A0ABX7W2T2_9GAMM|nr:hypothetical protein [Halomonas sulfidoxydans]QTP53947.1 hypothetical protein HNO51_04145 [Halomonas sulfidoxydans]
MHELVATGLTGMLVLVKLMQLRGWHAAARTLVGFALLPLALALASYVLPEYWPPTTRSTAPRPRAAIGSGSPRH